MFDMGGGTFDVSVLAIQAGHFRWVPYTVRKSETLSLPLAFLKLVELLPPRGRSPDYLDCNTFVQPSPRASHQDSVFEVKATAGDPHLGGEDAPGHSCFSSTPHLRAQGSSNVLSVDVPV